MDLAVIIAGFQRESCVLYRNTTHFEMIHRFGNR